MNIHVRSIEKTTAEIISISSVRFVKKSSEGRRLASTEGARLEAPQVPRGLGVGRGFPSPQPTRESGERRELHQRGWPQTHF